MLNRIQDNYASSAELRDAVNSARTKYFGLIGIGINAPDWDKRIKFHGKKLQADVKLISCLWQFAVSI